MKGLLRSKLALTFAALLMIAAAIAIPLSGSITRSHAQAPTGTIALSPTSGSPNTSVTAKGSGFPAGDIVEVLWVPTHTFLNVGTVLVKSDGTFSSTFTIPSDAALGNQTIEFKIEDNHPPIIVDKPFMVTSTTITKTFQLAPCSSPVNVAILNVGAKVSGTASLTSSDPIEGIQGENLILQETLGPYMKTVTVGSGNQSISFTEIAVNDVLTACILPDPLTGVPDSDQTATVTVTVTLASPSHPKQPFNEPNPIWSGYSATGKTFSTAESLWIQPKATCTIFKRAIADFWVGLDGDGSTTVEQTGTEAQCIGGVLFNFAWYEMFPAGPVPIIFADNGKLATVSAGDRMHAKVSFTGRSPNGKEGVFVLEIENLTAGWHFSTTQKASLKAATRVSSECIVERSQSDSSFTPMSAIDLTNFGTVQFLACLADGMPIASQPSLTLWILKAYKPKQPNLDRVSALTLGSAFDVTWISPGP